MKIAVYAQAYSKEPTLNAAKLLFDVLAEKHIDTYVEYHFHKILVDTSPENKHLKTFNHLDKTFDILVSIGGDGTILRAITYVKDLGIPIVGINTGRLGFLATVQTDYIKKALIQIIDGNYTISERALLTVATELVNKAISNINFALNEVTISRKNTTSMITVETHLNNDYLTSYWADGLILATPTGSTGYSLSCGGPVITPKTHSLVLTPIAPHNLSARPLVIPDDTSVSFKVDGREDQFLMSLDSRIITLPNTTKVVIKKADFKIKMIAFEDETFLDTLRQKLLWGEDRRN